MSSLILSSAELSDDCVSKFTSLVGARDLSSSANPLVRYCHFGVSAVNLGVNYSDSDSDKLFYIYIYIYMVHASVTYLTTIARVGCGLRKRKK